MSLLRARGVKLVRVYGVAHPVVDARDRLVDPLLTSGRVQS